MAEKSTPINEKLTISIICLEPYSIHIHLFFTMVNGQWVADCAMYSPFFLCFSLLRSFILCTTDKIIPYSFCRSLYFPLVILAVGRSPGLGATPRGGADGSAQSLGHHGGVRVAIEDGLLRWR